MSLEKLDVASLKKSGYMKQRQKDLFVVRLRMPCGNVDSEQLTGISRLAKKYGTGYVHITTRQGIQVPNIDIHNLDAITKELEDNGTPPGSCGPRVCNIIACPGNLECNYGVIDTYGLGGMLDKEFFGEDMPVKIKFAATGCPNACAKPEETVAIFRKIIDWSKKNTNVGERFGDCLERVGFDNFRQQIISKEIASSLVSDPTAPSVRLEINQ